MFDNTEQDSTRETSSSVYWASIVCNKVARTKRSRIPRWEISFNKHFLPGFPHLLARLRRTQEQIIVCCCLAKGETFLINILNENIVTLLLDLGGDMGRHAVDLVAKKGDFFLCVILSSRGRSSPTDSGAIMSGRMSGEAHILMCFRACRIVDSIELWWRFS